MGLQIFLHKGLAGLKPAESLPGTWGMITKRQTTRLSFDWVCETFYANLFKSPSRNYSFFRREKSANADWIRKTDHEYCKIPAISVYNFCEGWGFWVGLLIFLGSMWRNHFLKSMNLRATKFIIFIVHKVRGVTFISANNFLFNILLRLKTGTS